MSELDEQGLIFDQAGRLVETQFNAESILLVQHLKDSPAGKQCPKCGAAPLRQTRLVWEENTRRVSNGTKVLNDLAFRVAPPRPPRPVQRPPFGVVALVLSGVLLVLFLCSRQIPWDSFASIVQVVLLVVFIAAVGWIGASYFSFKEEVAADQLRVQQSLPRYESDRDRWRRSWFCSACGALTVEAS